MASKTEFRYTITLIDRTLLVNHVKIEKATTPLLLGSRVMRGLRDRNNDLKYLNTKVTCQRIHGRSYLPFEREIVGRIERHQRILAPRYRARSLRAITVRRI